MPNVTITIPSETYRRARVWAAQNNTNVSRAVREILEALPYLDPARIRRDTRNQKAASTSTRLRSQIDPNPSPQNPVLR